MRFSIWPGVATWADVREVVTHAEATGWDGAYVADHFMGDGGGFGAVEQPMLEATAALAALAVATERLRLGSLVFGNTYRHPAVLANWAASVDEISGGRLVLGVGAGWQETEHAQYGIRLPPPGERIRRFEEACQVWTGLLRRAHHHAGRRALRARPTPSASPRPVQQPIPLLIGGKGDRMMGVVARYADQWNMWGLADVIAERSAVLDQRCEAIGRDPAEITRSAQALVLLTDDEDAGPPLPGGHRRPGRRRRHHRAARRGLRGLAGRRPRRGHRPRLHPRHRPGPPRPHGRHHRAGRPRLPLIPRLCGESTKTVDNAEEPRRVHS